MAESERTGRAPGTLGSQGVAPQGGSSAGVSRPPEPAAQQAQERTAPGNASGEETVAQGQAVIRAWQTQLEHQVLEHPLQSLAIAAGIGLLVGLLQRR
jgi:DUF883 C-terminal glycine zipper region